MLTSSESFREHKTSPRTAAASLILWQRRVPWERKSTAPIGSKLETATICRRVASINTRFQKTKRLVARLAFANFQTGLEKNCPSKLNQPQLFIGLGDVKTGSLDFRVLQALRIDPLPRLLLCTALPSCWLAAMAKLQLALRLKVLLPIRSTIPTLPHSCLPTSIFRAMSRIWLSSVPSLRLVHPS